MRKVEIKEAVLNIGTMTYHLGDVVMLDDDAAARVIARGWGEDPETGERGERKPGAAPLELDGLRQAKRIT